ncbi:hypothetical protein FACS1894207_3370 [Bacteroidia bacterium]|nr:hypothetical protein FACS1894207_3370 [Bacteroidia bacterium]
MRKSEYVPIDSITERDISSKIIIDLKNKELLLPINGDSLLFKQDYNTDSIHNFPYHCSSLTAFANEKEEIHLTLDKLTALSRDSIYVSGYYQKFDLKKKYNTSRRYEIEQLAINKLELKVALLPSKIAYTDLRFEHYVQTQLTLGYSYMPKMKDIKSRANHAFEIGIAHSNVMRAIECASRCYYLSNEFLFNRDQFSIGPKIGANFIIWAFGLGSEFVYYTDFHENSLHWVAYIDVGLGAGNLRMAVHVPTYNRHFQDMGLLSLGLTFPIYTFSKKQIDIN